jgi:two-component system, cell cycle sensor histidine kinase and response regulator CckA
VHDGNGTVTHFISNDRDISDRRRLEAALFQAQKMDAIGQLAGGVAHDFDNLLMVISSYAELMQDSIGPEHRLHGNVQEILSASRRAADLTRQLLAFGRKQVQSLRVLDLNAVLQDVSKMLVRLIGEDIDLVISPASDLGKVKLDAVQLESEKYPHIRVLFMSGYAETIVHSHKIMDMESRCGFIQKPFNLRPGM